MAKVAHGTGEENIRYLAFWNIPTYQHRIGLLDSAAVLLEVCKIRNTVSCHPRNEGSLRSWDVIWIPPLRQAQGRLFRRLYSNDKNTDQLRKDSGDTTFFQ